MATDPRQEMNYALVRHTDMKEEMRTEAVEVIVSSVEKYQNKYDLAAKVVKETMDKKFAPNWHCIIGQGFGFEVVCERSSLLYLFLNGNLAVLLFKF
mmetsp:Transcript_20516/g.41573  ORF Transcript_20516/g.41573 Transcript_20516/m.41573 type:complete len:97 (-) Transcript_20516:160-450(-)